MEEDFLNRIKIIIQNHLDDENFGVIELASEMGLSNSQLLRKVKSLTSKSANKLIREIRLNEASYLIKNGDVIFSWSASLMVKIWDGDNCILNQHLFKVTSDEFPKWYYYLWSKHHLEEFISISSSHATTMGHIKRGDLDNAMVLVPTDDEMIEFSEIQTPIIDKIISNNKQLKKLVLIRETLLPKLVSGEIKVSINE